MSSLPFRSPPGAASEAGDRPPRSAAAEPDPVGSGGSGVGGCPGGAGPGGVGCGDSSCMRRPYPGTRPQCVTGFNSQRSSFGRASSSIRRSRRSGPALASINVGDHFQPWWEPERVGTGVDAAWRDRPGNRPHRGRHRRDGARAPLPPRGGGPVRGDSRGAEPRACLSRDRLRRVAQRVAGRHGLARHGRAGPAHGGGPRDHRPPAERGARRP